MSKSENEHIKDLEQLESILKNSKNRYNTTIKIAHQAKSIIYENPTIDGSSDSKKPISIAIESANSQ
jgi:DNA-directed RNA polymerase subunit K/omega